eukprot:431528-Prymnesium_polylepis.1
MSVALATLVYPPGRRGGGGGEGGDGGGKGGIGGSGGIEGGIGGGETIGLSRHSISSAGVTTPVLDA